MSTLLCEKDIYCEKAREHLITALRAALSGAESGDEEVTIYFLSTEITWNLADNEFLVIG